MGGINTCIRTWAIQPSWVYSARLEIQLCIVLIHVHPGDMVGWIATQLEHTWVDARFKFESCSPLRVQVTWQSQLYPNVSGKPSRRPIIWSIFLLPGRIWYVVPPIWQANQWLGSDANADRYVYMCVVTPTIYSYIGAFHSFIYLVREKTSNIYIILVLPIPPHRQDRVC